MIQEATSDEVARRILAEGLRFSGKMLRELREEKKLSRQALVLKMHDLKEGVDPQTLRRWEDGETVPDANSIHALAVILELKRLEDLYEPSGTTGNGGR